MKIDSSKPNFKARCPAVKNAQDVCRAVRNNFSYNAYSKAACEASSDILKNNEIKNFLLKKK